MSESVSMIVKFGSELFERWKKLSLRTQVMAGAALVLLPPLTATLVRSEDNEARAPKVVDIKYAHFDDRGWPIADKGEALPLYGVTDVQRYVEDRWMVEHPQNLSCKVVRFNDNGPTYRCLVANTFDLSEALLLNGGAKVVAGAPEPYRKAQEQAMAAKRGMWQPQDAKRSVWQPKT
jgi:hypothetical protein